jgi:DNA helicase-2/ATP-dependent DNA helicase PcrA
MEALKAHGRLRNGKVPRFVYPDDERLAKVGFRGDWNDESRRLCREDGRIVFDLFAAAVADLFERSVAVAQLYADKYPMLIVDEFQDTDDDQWRIVKALSRHATIICLADPEQRIFDFRPNISPTRIEESRAALGAREYSLGTDNHRSPDAGILSFADAVLRDRPLPKVGDVKVHPYWPRAFPATVHAAVWFTFARLREKGVNKPSVAVLARTNSLIAQISAALSEEHTYGGHVVRVVHHDVVWDAELAAAAARVVASVLEWPSVALAPGVGATLRLVAHYYRLKDAAHPSNSAAEEIRRAEAAAEAIERGASPRTKAAKELIAEHGRLTVVGNPVIDWRVARDVVGRGFAEIARESRMARLFGARDDLAAALTDRWLAVGAYSSAADTVKRVLDQQRLVAAERRPEGCILMNIHKSKGKEFDAVVLVEGEHSGQFFDPHDEPPFIRSRRLLRVAITRARKLVQLIRPHNARPLVSGAT